MQRGPSCSAELAPQPLLDGDPWAFLLFHAVPLVNPCLPAWEVLTAQLRLCGLGQSPIPLREFYQLWLTLTFIKDVIWSCINLLMGKTCGDIPPRKQQRWLQGRWDGLLHMWTIPKWSRRQRPDCKSEWMPNGDESPLEPWGVAPQCHVRQSRSRWSF